MFVDRVKITVRSGSGGDGASTFRREKYVPTGGPSGGDGGKGGNVFVLADSNMHTLMDFRYKKHFRADNGRHGQNRNMHGHKAEDLTLRVPPGTVVFDDITGKVLADLVQEGDMVLLLPGGKGGRGNARFATAVQQAPTIAEKGESGIEREIRLELKTIADVGLVGFPNAGKSTLLSVVSAARPKIADYHFTTLEPNLGVVAISGRSFIMADIPGLIEGAHEGQGLGHEFLRHVERTRILIHVVDGAGTEGRDPVSDIEVINNELKSYSPTLASRPQIIALNKIDAITDEAVLSGLLERLKAQGFEVYPISAVIGEGVEPLLHRAMDLVEQLPKPELHTIETVHEVESEVELHVSREQGVFVVHGTEVEKIISRSNVDNDEALQRLQLAFKRMGVFQLLRDSGIHEGDTVRIGETEFSFYDEEPE
ncbi:MAG: GTPase ObgE [Bacillota bacterium]|nr:GTPase ObgE [Bacillota bacterium]